MENKRASRRLEIVAISQDNLAQIASLPVDPLSEQEIQSGLVEWVELDWHQRRKGRQRVRGDRGTELLLVLPRGTVLADGQVLCRQSETQVTIAVRAQAEALLEIAPAQLADICRVAHHLGNWHRPIQVLADGTLLVERDRPLREWLERGSIPYRPVERAFFPNAIGHQHS